MLGEHADAELRIEQQRVDPAPAARVPRVFHELLDAAEPDVGLPAGFLVTLVVLTIFFGVYPNPVFDVTRASTAHLIQLHQQGVAVATASTETQR